jgi:hypothetical protein
MDYFNTENNDVEIRCDNDLIRVDNDLILISSQFYQIQTLEFIPREYIEPTFLKIHDELKNIQYKIMISSSSIAEFITIIFDFQFRKGASYYLEIFSDENLIYRAKAKAI